MSTDEQAGRASGSVPHAYRNAIFWQWAPKMPSSLPSAFVTLLYALGTAADPAGKLKFRDGKPVRIKDIAAAVKADEKDVRRYVDAAITAGVLGVEGRRRRGTATLYVLILHPRPFWDAAVSSLESSRRKPRKAPPWMQSDAGAPSQKNGGVSPELAEPKNGGHAPELEHQRGEEERGTRPRTGSGDTPPFGSGDTPPNNPGRAREETQEMAEVVDQPRVVGSRAVEKIISPQEEHDDHDATERLGVARCTRCHRPLVPDPRRPARTTHAHCLAADAHGDVA